MKIEINVTEEHIRNGVRGREDSCPIALALMDQGYRCVTVWPDDVSFLNKDLGDYTIYRGDLPRIATDFVYGFDGGEHVEPISFSLEVEKVPTFI